MAFLEEKYNYQEQNYVNIVIPYNTIIQLMKYTLTENRLITVSNLKRMESFFKQFNENLVYNETQQFHKDAIKILKELIHIQLEDSIMDYNILIEHLQEKFKDDIIENHLNEHLASIYQYCSMETRTLTDREIDRLNQYIKERYAALELYKMADKFKYIHDTLTMDRMSPSDLITEVKDDISQINKTMKRMTNNTASKNSFINFLESDLALEVMEDSIDKLRNPANKLRSGYVMHNKMINGGFENGRVYVYFGTPKSFKSGTLLNMVMSIALSNNAENIPSVDANKKPVIYYLTMENSMPESLDRIFEYITGESMSESKLSPQECINVVNNFTYNKTGISIIVEYRKNNEVSTDYLYEAFENMDDEGYQCILIVQDYLKRIRASDHIEDLRIRLGAISDEFTVFAKEKDIPLITAAQLNRDAYRNVEKAISENKTDIAKTLDRSQIAESAMILENIDYGIIINRENSKDPAVPDYLAFKLIASRGKQDTSRIEYFAQPFENSFKLEVDVDTGTIKGKESIGSNLEKTVNTTQAKANLSAVASTVKPSKNVSLGFSEKDLFEDFK